MQSSEPAGFCHGTWTEVPKADKWFSKSLFLQCLGLAGEGQEILGKFLFCITFWAGWLWYIQVWQFINHPDKETFVAWVGCGEVRCETDGRGAWSECPVGLFNHSNLPLPLFSPCCGGFDKLQSTTLKLKAGALFVSGRDTVTTGNNQLS